MTKEQRLIEGFRVKDMLDNVIDKYLARVNKSIPEDSHHILYEYPVYEKVNDEIWFIYFTSQNKDYKSEYPMKIYHQIVMGFNCMSEYYYNIDMIDADKNHSLSDLKIRFRNYLNMLLEDSDESKSL
jgi:hypothetical protein